MNIQSEKEKGILATIFSWRIGQVVVFVLLLILLGSLVTYKIDLPAADDMARHVINGRELVHGNTDVLYKNVFSYTMPDQSFVNHHWLSGVLFYGLLELLGWAGLSAFKVIVLVATFVLMFFSSLRKSSFWIVSLFSIPAILIFVERSTLRPEIFSYLFVAIYLFALTGLRSDEPLGKKIFWLIPLQVLWVNLHLFFIMGPAIIGGFLIERLFSQGRNWYKDSFAKRLGILFFLSLFACLFNPNGLKGALIPFQIFNDYGMPVIENSGVLRFFENTPPWDNISLTFFIPAVVLTALGFLYSFIQNRRSLFFFLSALATAIAGFLIARMVATFALIFLLVNSANWFSNKRLQKREQGDNRAERYRFGAFAIGISILIILTATGHISRNGTFGLGLSSRSEEAGAFLRSQNIKGPFFNDYDSGSYLINYLYPDERIFVDNRPEAFTADFFKQKYIPMLTNEDVWKMNVEEYGFNSIFLYRYNKNLEVDDFMYRRIMDPEWSLVFIDSKAVIFLRNNEVNERVISLYKITTDNIQDKVSYLLESSDYDDVIAAADAMCLLRRIDLFMEVYFKAVYTWPEKGKIWMIMGQWELTFADPRNTLLAISYFNIALEKGHKTPELYTSLGRAYSRIGYPEMAKGAYNKALSMNKNWIEAEAYIYEIENGNKEIESSPEGNI